MMAINLETIFQTVHNDETAIKFLQRSNIIPRVKMCKNGHFMKLVFYSSKPPLWECYKRSCKISIGIRKGTWLENSKISFQNVVLFIYFWSRETTTLKWCKHELGISKSTVIDWNNCLREVCVWRSKQFDSMIGGEGMTVEIDESLFVRRKDSHGKILPKQWIFGGLCLETKDCFAVQVPDRFAKTLLPIIRQKIRPGSKIVTDLWRAYNNIISIEFEHQMVNHRLHFVDPATLANTKQVKRMWGLMKIKEDACNKRRRGTNKNLMSSYLAEFMWRTTLNNRDPFQAILHDIAPFLSTQILQTNIENNEEIVPSINTNHCKVQAESIQCEYDRNEDTPSNEVNDMLEIEVHDVDDILETNTTSVDVISQQNYITPKKPKREKGTRVKLMHSEPIKNKCDKCEKTFRYNIALLKHDKIHSVVDDFECKVCGKTFKTRDHLSQHSQTHNNIQIFQCDKCVKIFIAKDGLVRHMETQHLA